MAEATILRDFYHHLRRSARFDSLHRMASGGLDRVPLIDPERGVLLQDPLAHFPSPLVERYWWSMRGNAHPLPDPPTRFAVYHHREYRSAKRLRGTLNRGPYVAARPLACTPGRYRRDRWNAPFEPIVSPGDVAEVEVEEEDPDAGTTPPPGRLATEDGSDAGTTTPPGRLATEDGSDAGTTRLPKRLGIDDSVTVKRETFEEEVPDASRVEPVDRKIEASSSLEEDVREIVPLFPIRKGAIFSVMSNFPVYRKKNPMIALFFENPKPFLKAKDRIDANFQKWMRNPSRPQYFGNESATPGQMYSLKDRLFSTEGIPRYPKEDEKVDIFPWKKLIEIQYFIYKYAEANSWFTVVRDPFEYFDSEFQRLQRELKDESESSDAEDIDDKRRQQLLARQFFKDAENKKQRGRGARC